MTTDLDQMRSKRGAESTAKSTDGAREQRRAEAEARIRALNARDAREGRWA